MQAEQHHTANMIHKAESALHGKQLLLARSQSSRPLTQ